jgi:hypothetical protein
MVARAPVRRAALALIATVATSAAIGCGTLIGIEDGVPDPGTSGADANDTGTTSAGDANKADTSTTPDATSARAPIGKSGGDQNTLPCGVETCAIPGQSCCAYRSSSQSTVYTGACAKTCAPPGAGTDRLAVLKCSGPSNCPSTAPRCCYQAGSSFVTTTCETSCISADAVLCDLAGQNTCGSTRSCQMFTGATMPPSWGYCN